MLRFRENHGHNKEININDQKEANRTSTAKKTLITETKTSLDEVHSKSDPAEIGITHMKHREKSEHSLVTQWRYSFYVEVIYMQEIFIQVEFQEGVTENIFKEMLVKLFLSLMKTKLTDPESSTSPGQQSTSQSNC